MTMPSKVKNITTTQLGQRLLGLRKSCSSKFVDALFTIARKWNQPTCPSAGKWIMKLTHPHREFYSAPGKNEVVRFSGKMD